MNLEKEIFDISLNDIIPNRFQPREIFNDNELNELAQSIKEHGVIQPIIVRKVGDKYEIIAGERRFRASQLAGQKTIPALVRDIDDRETAKVALLENLQRSNLTPIEEAKTYQTILKLDNITQDELARNLGKAQSTVANKLRLLTLSEEVQTALLNSQISERHARSLLSLDKKGQVEMLNRIINEKLTVRQLDEEIAKLTGKMPAPSEDIVDIMPKAEPTNIRPNPVNVQVLNDVEEKAPEEQETPLETQEENNSETSTPEITPVTNYNVNQINEEQDEVIQERPLNIFDKLRVPSENDKPSPELSIPSVENVIKETPKEENNNYNNAYDLRFAINNFRQAIQNTEKFGFKIKSNEYDNESTYQIVIDIEKQN